MFPEAIATGWAVIVRPGVPYASASRSDPGEQTPIAPRNLLVAFGASMGMTANQALGALEQACSKPERHAGNQPHVLAAWFRGCNHRGSEFG